MRPPPRRQCLAVASRRGAWIELDAFFADANAAVIFEADAEGPVVWMACDCGAMTARRADEDDRHADGRTEHR